MENAQKKISVMNDSTELGEQLISSADLMKRIKDDIDSAVKDGRSAVSKYYPLKPKQFLHDYPPLSSAEELARINQIYQTLYQLPKFESHRPFVGKFISKVKLGIFNFLWTGLLGEYLQTERNFNEQLVRYLNLSSQTTDFKFGSLFSELIRKIDIDMQGTNDRTDRLISSLDSTVRTIENQISTRSGVIMSDIEQIKASIARTASELSTIDNVARGLERTLALVSKSEAPSSVALTESSARTPINVDYLLLENRFRGSEEQISNSVKDYIPILKGVPGVVLDIGCGRGELLDALRGAGISAKGIDLDQSMVLRCREKQLDVELRDLFDYLSSSEDGSFGAIIATQVVEHLTQKQLDSFISLTYSKLNQNGVVIFETINPQSVTALARNFFRDPTHTFPVHPETLKFAMEMKGFVTDPIFYRSPYPADATLSKIAYSPELPARWLALLDQLNDNFTRLNDLLFGYQDFAVIGRKP